MSRNRRTWWAVALASVFTMTPTLVGVPAASAAEAFVAPEPKYFNVCGTSNDRLEVPAYFVHPTNDLGGYYVNGAPTSGTFYASAVAPGADGIRRVIVTTDYDSGSWAYAFDDQACGAPAPNAYSVSAGLCDPASRETTAYATVTNVADSSAQSLDVYVGVRRLQDGWSPGSLDYSLQIVDGETRQVQVKGTQTVGLLPGDYEAMFYEADLVTVRERRTFTVQSCNGLLAPAYPNPDDTGNGGTNAAKPKGSLRQVRGTTKMKVKMVNRKVAAKTTFTVTIDKPGKGGKTVRTFKVRKNAVKKPKRPFVAPVGTTFVLRAVVTFTRPDGSAGTKKMIITRNKVRPGTSGKTA